MSAYTRVHVMLGHLGLARRFPMLGQTAMSYKMNERIGLGPVPGANKVGDDVNAVQIVTGGAS